MPITGNHNSDPENPVAQLQFNPEASQTLWIPKFSVLKLASVTILLQSMLRAPLSIRAEWHLTSPCLSLPGIQRVAILLSLVSLNPHGSYSKPNIMVEMISLTNRCWCSFMFLNARVIRALIQNQFVFYFLLREFKPTLLSFQGN